MPHSPHTSERRKSTFVQSAWRISVALAALFLTWSQASSQVTPLCATPTEVHFECDYNEMLDVIHLYEDTLSSLLEETISEKYWLIDTLENGRIWFTYNCDTLYAETLELMARIEAARVPPGSYDPCSNFLNVVYYGTGIRCLGGATGGRDYLDNCWFATNLQTIQFANGDTIEDAAVAAEWLAADGPARALYEDDTEVLDAFGLHYNPYAILDPRRLCPPGWTLPDSTEVDNLQTWASESNQLAHAQRRASDDAEWAPFESVHMGDGVYENQPTTQFYALQFENASVQDSLPYFGNNSSFNSANPQDRLLGANEAHGLTVRCRRMVESEIEADPDYLAWAATPQAATISGPASYWAQMPHVHTLAYEGDSLLRGQVFYTGPGAVKSAGFKWGSNALLSGADSVVSETNDYPPAEWGEDNQLEVIDSIFVELVNDLVPNETYYYAAWAENNFGYSYGDTLSFTFELPPFACGIATVNFDGHNYGTTLIGEQCWFSENLQSTIYADGTAIPEVTDGTEWQNATTGARCAMSNDATTVATKGYLYNQHAVLDERHLCPTGWHVPTDDEWKDLERHLGVPEAELDNSEFGSNWRGTDEDLDLKSESPAWDGNNSTGYSALPLGNRGFVGSFYNANSYHMTWTSTPQIYRALTWGTNGIQRSLNDERMGASIRCILGSGATAPQVSTGAATDIDLTTASLNGELTAEGDSAVTATGFIYSANPDLSGGTEVAGSALSGSFSGATSSLEPATTYYFSAFATSAVGTTYGDTLSFTTLTPPALVETADATGVTDASAGISGSLNGDVVTGDVTESGFIWSTFASLSGGEEVTGTLVDGVLTASIDGLEEGTNYYYVAFVTDDNGRSYGDTLVFRTSLRCSDETLSACGTETIVYQDYEYNLFGVGDQCWFRENLRSDNYTDGTPILRGHWMAQFGEPYADEGVVSYYGEGYSELDVIVDSYGGVEALIDRFGYIYNAYAAQNPKGLCPTGWHISTLEDVAVLEGLLPKYEGTYQTDWASVVNETIEGQVPPCFHLDQAPYFNPGDYHFNDIYIMGNTNSSILLMGDITPPPYEGIAMSFYNHGTGAWMDRLEMGAPVRCVKGENTIPEVFVCGPSTVNYNGHDYSTFTNWDGQCWFQEDLKTELYTNGDTIAGNLSEAEWLATEEGAQAVYNDDETHLETYGRLYNHNAIQDERGVCPTDWRVSTSADWDDVFAIFGGTTNVGFTLKSPDGWNGGGSQILFHGLPGGLRSGEASVGYQGSGQLALWWANQATPKAYFASSFSMDMSEPIWGGLEAAGFSVRCVKEASAPVVETRQATLVTNLSADINGYVNYMEGDEALTEIGFLVSEDSLLSDATEYTALGGWLQGPDGSTYAGSIRTGLNYLPRGNTYFYTIYATNAFGTTYGDTLSFTTDFVCGNDGIYYDLVYYGTTPIGDVCWMTEDLRVTTYRDGTTIPNGLTASEWTSTTDGARAKFYEDDESSFFYNANAPSLYNWEAVNSGELCPPGYRVATDEDWSNLETAIAGDVNSLITLGYGPATTNSTGFNALSQGTRSGETGEWISSSSDAAMRYWTASASDGFPWHRNVTWSGVNWLENPSMSRENDQNPKAGMLVRCVKE